MAVTNENNNKEAGTIDIKPIRMIVLDALSIPLAESCLKDT
jgi:hypothetical protein